MKTVLVRVLSLPSWQQYKEKLCGCRYWPPPTTPPSSSASSPSPPPLAAPHSVLGVQWSASPPPP